MRDQQYVSTTGCVWPMPEVLGLSQLDCELCEGKGESLTLPNPSTGASATASTVRPSPSAWLSISAFETRRPAAIRPRLRITAATRG
jgi:hypothetical protein